MPSAGLAQTPWKDWSFRVLPGLAQRQHLSAQIHACIFLTAVWLAAAAEAPGPAIRSVKYQALGRAHRQQAPPATGSMVGLAPPSTRRRTHRGRSTCSWRGDRREKEESSGGGRRRAMRGTRCAWPVRRSAARARLRGGWAYFSNLLGLPEAARGGCPGSPGIFGGPRSGGGCFSLVVRGQGRRPRGASSMPAQSDKVLPQVRRVFLPEIGEVQPGSEADGPSPMQDLLDSVDLAPREFGPEAEAHSGETQEEEACLSRRETNRVLDHRPGRAQVHDGHIVSQIH
jgi:hypothetical protein